MGSCPKEKSLPHPPGRRRAGFVTWWPASSLILSKEPDESHSVKTYFLCVTVLFSVHPFLCT